VVDEAKTVISWNDAAAAEFELLHGQKPADYGAQAFAVRQSALCLSGGGIRSAAFCLGVLQAFARQRNGDGRLLTRFHYLSTVSGGGYIGSWLQVLMHEQGTQAAMEALQKENPPEVAWLRQFSSYLSPAGGILSKDAWAGVMLYLRNLMLNWMVFLPFAMLLTVVAVFQRTAFAQFYNPPLEDACHRMTTVAGVMGDLGPCQPPIALASIMDWPDPIALGLGVLGAACLVVAVVSAASMLPSHRGPGHYVSETTIRRWAVYPSLAWSLLTPLALAPWFEGLANGEPRLQFALPFVFCCLTVAAFALASLGAFGRHCNWAVSLSAVLCAGVGLFASGQWGAWAGALIGGLCYAALALLFAIADLRASRQLGAYVCNLFPWIAAAAMGGLLLWIGEQLAGAVAVERRAEVVAAVGPLWLIMCHNLLSAMFVGLRREVPHAELDREWLARLSALKFRVAVFWAVFAAATLILSRVGLHEDRAWGPVLSALAAGPVAAWLGKQAMSRLESLIGGKALAASWSMILNVLAALFAIAAAAVLGRATDELYGPLQGLIDGWLRNPHPWLPTQVAGWLHDAHPWVPMLITQAALLAVLGAIHFIDARRINVNRFSMHGVYRNRLIRAFLRGGRLRQPHDAFTNFDDADNPKLHELMRVQQEPERRLFPVLGMTVNLTGAGRLDWTERKGASFTATPLHCGAGYARDGAGAYVDSASYAWRDGQSKRTVSVPGISLGTAMTISGAAVSPNWGYHSSQLTAFLMTLFNVRLGAWLPNPIPPHPTYLGLAKPKNVFQALLAELLGSADDTRQAIYLSDGGHFDNLGLYEMFRRRCAVIVVADAAADPDCRLFDLGAALRRAEIDMEVRVEWTDWLASRKNRKAETKGLGFGRISYKEGGQGVLVYLKPDYAGDVPVDIRAYGEEHPTFPNESTLDQWFTESQFESYRALGEFQTARMLAKAGAALSGVLDPAADWEKAAAELSLALAR
jgi:hypothetical protein